MQLEKMLSCGSSVHEKVHNIIVLLLSSWHNLYRWITTW